MKKLVIIGLAVAVGAGGWWLASPDRTNRSYTTHKSYNSPPPNPPTSTLTDSTEVFQKAFWKRPTADDTILHAERREWADAEGVQRWQWFIAVEPSATLVKHLREDNAFSLAPAKSVPVVKDAPEWFAFPSSDVEILQAPRGEMCLFFSKTKRLLLATDSGGGFHPGATESAKPPPAPTAGQVVSGRLPKTPPPTPPKK